MNTPELATLTFNALLVVLSGLAIHRLVLAIAARHAAHVPPPIQGALPTMLVQIPLYNERFVARRVIDAVAALDYPRDRLTVQILDDSSDATVTIAGEACREWRARGLTIEHVRRGDRSGFKAGALALGLSKSDAELVAVFDADFVPHPDFLLRLVPDFTEPRVGMVQARWSHLNRNASALTRVQALLLDGHFVNEHGGRFALGCFFNFNGTCGIWRRAAIDDAGGWSGDTLTEDLDLSYRAQLRGWRFVYRREVDVPGELPTSAAAFESQQHRWAKGAIETAKKLLPGVWRARGLRLRHRVEATLHLGANFAYPLALGLALLLPFAAGAPGAASLLDGALLACTTLGLLLPLGLAVAGARAGWRNLFFLPHAVCIGMGLAVNNSRAVLSALVGRRSPFVRTPKTGSGTARPEGAAYHLPAGWQRYAELSVGSYLAASAVLVLTEGRISASLLLAAFACGFLQLALSDLVARMRRSRAIGATVEQ